MNLKLDYKNFRYDDKYHKYTLGNIELLSVTQILSVISDYEYSNQSAMDRGTYIHKCCAMFLKGTLDFDKLEPDIQKSILNWSNFLLNNKLINIEVLAEVHLYSEKYYYSGTLDYIFFTEREVIVVDIKTGGEYKSDPYQLYGYCNLVKENFDIDKPIILYNLYLKRSSIPEKRIFTKRDFNKFLCFKITYQEKNNL